MRIFLTAIIVLASYGWVLAADKRLPESHAEIQLSFSKTVKKVSPTVVNVFSSKVVAGQRSIFSNNSFFEQFFGGQFGRSQPRVQKSLGSGIIVDAKGTIVTNYHVIEGGTKIRVVLADFREYEARVILKDERSDLAVLEIIADKDIEFEHIIFADSDAVEVGDLTLALGNPFGVGQTVTSGIVSAVARTNIGISDFQFFIQTDAAINPGNSGGALVDSLGRLIGVNTAIFSRSGGSNGIGFAIPANMVKLVVNAAKIGNRVQRPWMGAKLQSLNNEIALSLGLEKPEGVLVLSGLNDAPLYQSGIQRGDLIIAMDGKKIINEEQFGYQLSQKFIGSVSVFSVLRDDEIIEISVNMVVAPENPPRRQTVIDGNNPFAGIEVVNISPAVAEEMSLPLDSEGVIISHIEIGSVAQRFGFKIGDIIVSISNVKIRRVGDLLTEVSYGKKFWRFSINRGGRVINSIVNG
ncbi:MAG: Do family serine endopeptidase [Rhizobiales bacterium]|nr:Do family serine endopeptidase [Hyphomicrobiales bacterium]NRB13682.1 Do family serine endopeptidase [Hyphomicrobiales bacterium]